MGKLKERIILKGIGASPGKVRGKVKIINFPEEIDEINKTGIIVASFLTPDFLTIIKRSPWVSGIITNKGGLTCHAAIVARELKIPYIAGTAVATKKLKENMIIIIDGEKGIAYA